jgi:hypothetical protein
MNTRARTHIHTQEQSSEKREGERPGELGAIKIALHDALSNLLRAAVAIDKPSNLLGSKLLNPLP